MPKASEIARSRRTARDSMQWLAAIAGFLGTMVCAFVAVIFAPVRPDFFPLLGVAVAAVVVPAAIALYAMRESSAEFKGAWIALLAIVLLAWVAGGGWIKRTTGTAGAVARIDAATQTAREAKEAMDEGRTPKPMASLPAPDSGNPLVQVSHRFEAFHARSVQHYREYLKALDASEWSLLLDPDMPRSDVERKRDDARFEAGVRAIDAWYAAETADIRRLRNEVAPLGLSAELRAQVDRRLRSLEVSASALGYSEKLLLYRARDVARALDENPWRRVGTIRMFEDQRGAGAHADARALYDRAVANRELVLLQLHGSQHSVH